MSENDAWPMDERHTTVISTLINQSEKFSRITIQMSEHLVAGDLDMLRDGSRVLQQCVDEVEKQVMSSFPKDAAPH